MGDWKSGLNSDPTDWLLQEDNPSVRYLTLLDILDLAEDDPAVTNTKRRIMDTGAVPKILAKQKKGGYWENQEDFYIRTKYKGIVWQLIVLASLEADGNNTRIKKACEFILENSQDRQSGGFHAFCWIDFNAWY